MNEATVYLTTRAQQLKQLSAMQKCTGCSLMNAYFSRQYRSLKRRVDCIESLRKTNNIETLSPNVNTLHQSVAMLGMYLQV